MSDYLTTKELADLLRIKERKVYDLVSSGSVPCTKATGKLLFSRQAINVWLSQHGNELSTSRIDRPNVFLGSHDPLLDWAIRESSCGIATWFDGSAHGLERFREHEGIASGLHIFNPDDNSWNTNAVQLKCDGVSAVLIEWARRTRGLVLGKHVTRTVTELSDIEGLHFAARQNQAGAQDTFVKLLQLKSIDVEKISFSDPHRTENDAAVEVLSGDADVTFGLQALANKYKLKFVPIIEERFDLIVDRRSWFDPPMQSLLQFTRSKKFTKKVSELAGYDTANMGSVHLNL